MVDAASIPLAAMTSLQALRGYEGDLEGKTVFIPAGRRFFLNSTITYWMLTLSQWVERAFSPVS